MISGTFHVMSQEWRYYSREKSLIHTLHLGQLPDSRVGESVFITVVPPTGSQNHFTVPPITLPDITPYRGSNITKVTNNIPPLWANAPGGFPIQQFQSGSYGNWSGVQFAGLSEAIPDTDIGEWYLPATGGAFIHFAGFLGQLSTVTSPSKDMLCTFQQSIAQPLIIPVGGPAGPAPDPSNYANAYQTWQSQFQLVGTNWENVFGGGRSLDSAGNATGESPGIIVDTVPFFAWLGRHETDIHPHPSKGFNLLFRLGP